MPHRRIDTAMLASDTGKKLRGLDAGSLQAFRAARDVEGSVLLLLQGAKLGAPLRLNF